MAKAAKKKTAVPMIVFSRARDVPFDRIRLPDSNVREINVEDGLDDLTHDIDRREDLIQGLNVRAILDADGNETGDFETPAGGRRYRSIARLVEAGRFPPDGLVPCIVKKTDAKTSAVDDSLAENLLRLALHPLDQFKAFKRMVDMGMSKEEIADAWRTTPRYIMQRLRLATVAPSLLDAYARNEMTLAMLEAFTVNPDHERQEQVWERVKDSWQKEPWYIRNMLTETAVRPTDKRVRFIGVDAYEQSGGLVLRDLFSDENGGWLQDPMLLDKLVGEKLKAAAEQIAAEGWKWIEVALSFPYGHENGLRELVGTTVDLTDEERATREALRDEYDRLEAEHAEAEEWPDEVDQRLGEIEQALDEFDSRPMAWTPDQKASAGVFVSIASDGTLLVNRGFVRPEDEAPVEGSDGDLHPDGAEPGAVQPAVITINGQVAEPEEEDDVVKPLPERLVVELTAHRTLALRDAVASNPRVAITALIHTLVRDCFGVRTHGSAMQAAVREVHLPVQSPDLSESVSAKSIDARHDAWKADMPLEEDDALWTWIDGLDEASRQALLAHCVSFGVNALYERPNPYSGMGISQTGLDRRLCEADRLAEVTGLDLIEAGWRPTVANYLGRVTKTRIIEAVREGVGEDAVQLIEHMKKGEMATEAERLLADSGWLPEPLRMPVDDPAADLVAAVEHDALPAFLAGDPDEAETGETEQMVAAV